MIKHIPTVMTKEELIKAIAEQVEGLKIKGADIYEYQLSIGTGTHEYKVFWPHYKELMP